MSAPTGHDRRHPTSLPTLPVIHPTPRHARSEYADLARVATLLHPEPGDPGERQSSLGGTPLWPADEPWPYCAQEGHWTYGSDPRNHTEIVPGAVPARRMPSPVTGGRLPRPAGSHLIATKAGGWGR
ncbi:hypothetical protein ACIRPR_04540 [Streptomyces griseoflavus]|uniref:hypothetical protein n=1 Tax=Streptomyces griseoflavus TaxID=35619 RepID=UPI0038021AAE